MAVERGQEWIFPTSANLYFFPHLLRPHTLQGKQDWGLFTPSPCCAVHLTASWRGLGLELIGVTLSFTVHQIQLCTRQEVSLAGVCSRQISSVNSKRQVDDNLCYVFGFLLPFEKPTQRPRQPVALSGTVQRSHEIYHLQLLTYHGPVPVYSQICLLSLQILSSCLLSHQS